MSLSDQCILIDNVNAIYLQTAWRAHRIKNSRLTSFAQRGIYPKLIVHRTINAVFIRKPRLDALSICRRLPRCARPNKRPVCRASTTLGDRGRARSPTKCERAQRVNFVSCRCLLRRARFGMEGETGVNNKCQTLCILVHKLLLCRKHSDIFLYRKQSAIIWENYQNRY